MTRDRLNLAQSGASYLRPVNLQFGCCRLRSFNRSNWALRIGGLPVPDNREKKSVLRILAYRQRALDLLTGPPALAFVPAISLAAFWFGGEGALLVMAALVPAAYLLSGGFGAAVEHLQNSCVNSNGILARAPMTEKCEDI